MNVNRCFIDGYFVGQFLQKLKTNQNLNKFDKYEFVDYVECKFIDELKI